MTQVIANLLNGFIKQTPAPVRPTSVDSAVSALQKAVEDLNHVRQHHEDKAASHQRAIDFNLQQREASVAEAARAQQVAERLGAIVG
jgi:hypothetical protein